MTSPGLHELLSKYDELFQEHLGTFKDYKAKIMVDPGATPRFCKAHTVPYAMREKVEEELDRLVAERTLEPVDYSDWAAPIVAVMKSDCKGLFCYTRLPYGISTTPGIFQKAMEQLLQGIPHVTVYIDDIFITAETEAEHLKILEEVFKRLAKAELKVKKHKCKFMVPSVPYLGHVIDEKGLDPLPEKVEAIRQAPTPKNVTELKWYLGLLTY